MEAFDDAQKVASRIGEIWQDLQNSAKDDFFFSSPLSRTLLPLYDWVIKNKDSFRWDGFRFVLMDEQDGSYERFASQNLLVPLGVDKIIRPDISSLHVIDGLIAEHGGLDLLILATGLRGHYAQVMPGTKEDVGFHLPELLPEFIEYHKRGIYSETEFSKGVSIGPKQVLEAKLVIVIITGSNKRDIAKKLLSMDSFDPDFPISIVHHPKLKGRFRIFISKAAI